MVGVVGGGSATINFGPIIMKDASVLGVTVFNAPRNNLISVVNLASQKTIRPVIDKILPLKDAASAQKLLEDRNQFGKVILKP